jgi:putative DNA primase/helicase
MTSAPKNLILDPSAPYNTALAFVETKYSNQSARALHYYKGEFFYWTGTHYLPIETDTIRAEIYDLLDSADCPDKKGSLMPFRATRTRVTDVQDALKAVANLPDGVPLPAWISKDPGIDPSEIIACTNGLLHIPTRRSFAHTPDFFNSVSLPFPYDASAPEPVEWLKFLRSLWDDDTEAIATLQEIFGYFLTSDTSQQKLFLLIGPTRSGKGVICRVLRHLLGSENVPGPTLASLSSNFGLAPLIGKQLAIIADARIGARNDHQAIAERLLSISGEDSLTIDRKYLPAWTGRLPVRFLIASNELPRLADVSGALAKRFITLVLKKSFLGREDRGILKRVLTELPGVLNWALDGRDRLAARGYFIQPVSSSEVTQELEDLSSAIKAFLRERCVVGAAESVEVDALYATWTGWSAICGRERPGTKQVFGRDLRAALPGLLVHQPRDGNDRKRVYQGVGLKPEPRSS